MLCTYILQDMTQENPTQELVAEDIHGVEWKFKHIYRGNLVFILEAFIFYLCFSCMFKLCTE